MEQRRGPGCNKCKFVPSEDAQLARAVRRYGCHNWAIVAQNMPGRSPRQCRERWTNYTNPALDHSALTEAEKELLEEKFEEIGPRWAVIASFFPGRGRNFLKNYCILKRKRDRGRLTGRDTGRNHQDDQPGAPPPPPPGGTPFDKFFQDLETQDIFWEPIAADHF
jgi:hypothetical protein